MLHGSLRCIQDPESYDAERCAPDLSGGRHGSIHSIHASNRKRMGIQPAAASLLLKEASRRPFTGVAATLGRQHIYLSYEMLRQRAQQAGVELKSVSPTLHREASLAEQGYLSDESFLEALGFESSLRLDVSAYEAAEELLDLNMAETPSHLEGAFDVIIDAGTLEHVFHLPNAFAHLVRMLKPGGRIIHLSPSSNHIDHGFWMFSPTLFWDYYSANEFEINTVNIVRYTPQHTVDSWLIYKYDPGCLSGDVMWGGLDAAMYGLFVVVTRTTASTSHRIPQQGWYIRRWADTGSSSETTGKADALLRRVQHSRPLTLAARGVISAWRSSAALRKRFRRKGLSQRPIARY